MKQFFYLYTSTFQLLVGIDGRAVDHRGEQTNTAPNIISIEPGFVGLPTLTPEQVALLQSQVHVGSRTNFEASVPRGLKFMPVQYILCSPLGRDEKAHPYTETVSVCRLNEQKDLVVVEDNRTGVDVVRRWFIRDIPVQAQRPGP